MTNNYLLFHHAFLMICQSIDDSILFRTPERRIVIIQLTSLRCFSRKIKLKHHMYAKELSSTSFEASDRMMEYHHGALELK